jgi:O-antigen ligase
MSNIIISKIFFVIDFIILLLPLFFFLGAPAVNVVLFFFSILFLYISYKKKRWFWIHENYSTFFLLFWIYTIILSFFAEDFFQSLKSSFFLIKFFLFFLLISFYSFNKFKIEKILKVWLVFINILCLDILFQYITKFDIFGYPEQPGSRYAGFFGEELVAGSFLAQISAPVFGFVLYFIFFKKEKLVKKILLSINIFFILFSCLITGERMNSIFLLILITAVLGLFIFYKKKYLTIIFFIVILSLAAISYNNLYSVKKRYDDFSNSITNFYFSSHGKLFDSAYRLWVLKPITGWGLKNFRVICDKKLENRINNTHPLCSSHPHNLYLELLVETGIIGFTIYFIFIYLLMKKFFMHLKSTKKNLNYYIVASTLVAILLILFPIKSAGSFATSWNGTFFWLLLAIIFNKVSNQKKYYN